jgi:hypothetical protein
MTRLQLCKALQERRGLRLTPTIEPVEVLLRYLPAQVVRDICHATDGGVCIEIADDSVCFERGALLREELRLMNTRSQPIIIKHAALTEHHIQGYVAAVGIYVRPVRE